MSSNHLESSQPNNKSKTKTQDEQPQEEEGVVVLEKKCSVCQILKVEEAYSRTQWKRPPALKIKCHVCVIQEEESNLRNSLRLCSICLVFKYQESFSKRQWKGFASTNSSTSGTGTTTTKTKIRTCKPCWENEIRSKSNKRNKPHPVSTAQNHDDNNDDNDDNQDNDDNNDMHHNQNGNDANASEIQSLTRKKKKRKKNKQQQEHSKEKVKQLSIGEMKRILKHRIHILPEGQTTVKSIHLTYDTYTPITPIDEQNMMDQIMERGYYGPFPELIQTQRNLEAYLESGKTKMNIHQALSLRSAVLQHKARQRHWYLKVNVKKLFQEYNRGMSIVHIAKRYDIPPMNVLRQMLSNMNYSKAKMKRGFKNPKEEFEEREIREFYAADAVDCVSTSNQDEILKKAEAFEMAIESILVQMNVSFVTQKDLEREQQCEFGKPFVTPDFLILDDLYVNGQRIRWIDAKAFYGSNIKSQISDTARQMKRYIELWGVGSIIFLRGYNENFARLIDDCIMMDWITFSESKVTFDEL
jgi:hypothetical protein